jgi:hypothetical protein
MSSAASRQRVFLDVSIGTEPAGRLVIELFTDQAPKTCEKYVNQYVRLLIRDPHTNCSTALDQYVQAPRRDSHIKCLRFTE